MCGTQFTPSCCSKKLKTCKQNQAQIKKATQNKLIKNGSNTAYNNKKQN